MLLIHISLFALYGRFEIYRMIKCLVRTNGSRLPDDVIDETLFAVYGSRVL